MKKFTARTRLRGRIRYYEAEWWVYGNGYTVVMFKEGPYKGKSYQGADVAIAWGEKWKLESEVENGKGAVGI